MKKEEEWLLKEKYHGEKTHGFYADCERLKKGEPLAYLIGHIPFLDVTIHLDSHPLIPRPETEYWVERIIAKIKSGQIVQGPTLNDSRPDLERFSVRVLDLCAGSGCIGVAVLKAIKEARVDFAELDPLHHETIRKNIESNGLEISRADIVGGDLFENVQGQYDYILSNPPYIDPAHDRTEPSVRAHEPKVALYGGEYGLELIHRIIETAPPYLLHPDGSLIIEHEPEHVTAIVKKANECGLTATSIMDQYDVFRYTVLTRNKEKTVSPY